MTKFEQAPLMEISTLPESRRADVLAFVRYLKLCIPIEEMEIEKRFDRSLKSIRSRAKKLNISQEDINGEICAVRAEYACRD